MRGSRGEMMTEEVIKTGRKRREREESLFPPHVASFCNAFPLITLMTNLKQFKSHFGGSTSPFFSLTLLLLFSTFTLMLQTICIVASVCVRVLQLPVHLC